jgi:hypothetical protein
MDKYSQNKTLAQPTIKNNKNMSTTLDKIKEHTKVVADTGDFGSIKAFTPLDATTSKMDHLSKLT